MSVSPRVDRREQQQIFRTVTALIAGDTMLATLVIPALPLFAHRYSLSNAAVVLIFGIFPLSQVVTTGFLAGTIDRIGRRPTMVAGAVGLLVATAGFAIADSVPLLIVTRSLQGAAAALVWTAGLAALSDVYPQDNLGFRIGLAETIGAAIGLIGPVAGGSLIDLVGTGEAFMIATILPAILLVMTLTTPETMRPSAPPPLREAFARLVARPEAKAGIISLVLVAAIFAMVDSLLPLNLNQRLGASTASIGAVFGFGLAGMVISGPLAGAWSDRHGRRPALLAGGLISAAALPFVAIGPIWLVAVGLFVMSAGLATLLAPAGALLVLAADRVHMNGIYGVTSGINSLVFATGYTLGPLLGAASSVALSLLSVSALAAVLMLCSSLVIHRLLPTNV
jgi:MFS transporter, DHA1 family, solute carrier family 18 (vesicular amine transporter), member 1/2